MKDKNLHTACIVGSGIVVALAVLHVFQGRTKVSDKPSARESVQVRLSIQQLMALAEGHTILISLDPGKHHVYLHADPDITAAWSAKMLIVEQALAGGSN